MIDDFSKDRTAVIAKKYTSKVFVRKHAERSVQRNFGAKISKGDYLIFLDADMELTSGVIKDIVATMKGGNFASLIIPEKTVGEGFIQRIRKFEREMYMGDFSIEVARVFKRNVFFEFKGYDENLTGPEDYDLPYRIGKKYRIGRAHKYLLHHEERLTLRGLLGKKYKYAQKGARYAFKHPKLILVQGTILFRKVYLRHWKKFFAHPVLGLSFVFVRALETSWAVAGFVSAVGIFGFIKTLFNLAKK